MAAICSRCPVSIKIQFCLRAREMSIDLRHLAAYLLFALAYAIIVATTVMAQPMQAVGIHGHTDLHVRASPVRYAQVTPRLGVIIERLRVGRSELG
jgi:hypothetical protein